MIRQATRYDIPKLLKLIEQYCYEAPIEILKAKEHHSVAHVENLLFQMIVGKGFVLVDDEFKGAIGGIITPNVWCPEVMELHELFWYVKPEYRNGIIGGKLLIKFDDMAQNMMQTGRIQLVHISKMPSSPNIKYEKLGFKPLNINFYRE